MTERRDPPPALPAAATAAAARTPRATPKRRPRLLSTALASLACFLVLFEFLAFQLSSGNDPALGATTVAAAAPKRPVVIDRKVIRTQVVHLPPKSQPASSTPPVPAAASTSSVPASAPVAAPAAAPAPASAPAAPVTSSS